MLLLFELFKPLGQSLFFRRVIVKVRPRHRYVVALFRANVGLPLLLVIEDVLDNIGFVEGRHFGEPLECLPLILADPRDSFLPSPELLLSRTILILLLLKLMRQLVQCLNCLLPLALHSRAGRGALFLGGAYGRRIFWALLIGQLASEEELKQLLVDALFTLKDAESKQEGEEELVLFED